MSQAIENLNEQIELEKQKSKERIAKLRARARAQEKRINTKVVALLKKQHRDIYDQLADTASKELEAEKAKRSQRARKKESLGHEVPSDESTLSANGAHGTGAPWVG